jgi:hypothetical protein
MKPALALLVLLLPFAALPAAGQQLPDIPTIAVPAGGATVTGQLAAGGRNVYYVKAASLQALMVSFASPGNKAVFQVYGTGALVSGTATSAVIDGQALTDAGPRDASMAWMGTIPQNGLYLIAVDSKDGPTDYTLTVQLQ